MTTRKLSQRYARALALEPRILLDAAAVETAAVVAQQTSEADYENPGFSATPVEVNLTVTDTSDVFPSIDLFSDVSVSPNTLWGETGDTGRPLNDLTISINATGASHALVIDGTTITLEGGTSGETADNGYFYQVNVSGSSTTIVVAIDSSLSGYTADGAAALIDSIAYQAQDLGVTTSDLSVSLMLDDSNGDATEKRITATVHITRDSDLPAAPVVSTEASLEPLESFDSTNGLDGADQVTYSADGRYVYTAGADTFTVFSVDASGRLTLMDSITVENLDSVQSLVASSDGKSVYSLSSNGNLVELSVEADGTLSHVGTYSVSSDSSGSLAISADGTQLYADGGDNQRAVKVYARDPSTGRLTVSQQFPSVTLSDEEYDALTTQAGYAGNYNGATLTIVRSDGAEASDDYSFATLYYYDEEEGGGTLSYRDGQLYYDDYSNEIAIATFVNTNGTLTITFTEDVSSKMVNLVLNQISFQTTGAASITLALQLDQAHSQNISLGSASYGLQALQSLDNAIRQTTVIQAGNYLYIVNNGGSLWGNRTLEVYQRNDDGTWSVVDNITQLNAGTDWSSMPDAIAVSADGLYAYVSAQGSGTLDVYQLDTTSGFLNRVNSIALTTDADSLSLDADGEHLYIVTSDGTVSVYAVSGSRLTLQGSVTGISSGDMALSSDGLSLIIANGEGITRYSLAKTLNLGENSAFASDLSLADNNSDKLADGIGNYQGASIIITPSVASGSFSFLENNGLRLADGYILNNGSVIASFSTADDGTLTITFNADTSSAVANQVLQQITYRNDTASLAGSLITLAVRVSDGELTSATQNVTLRMNTLPVLDTSVAEGYTLRGATSETPYSFTLFRDLFSDMDGDALTWSVSGLPDGLTFDPQTLTISGSTTQVGAFFLVVSATDAGGNAATLELTLEVAQIANRAPTLNGDASSTLGRFTEGEASSISLDDNLFTDADALYGDSLTWAVEGLPAGLTFNAETLTISGTSSVVADHTLTIRVTDESGKSASTELTLRVISTAEAYNQAPNLTADANSLIYTNGTLSGYGSTGTYINGLVLSNDETILVVASSTSNNGNGTHYLNVYSRDTTTGALTLLQVFTQGTEDNPDTSAIEFDGLQNVTSITYSSDGTQLYLTGYNTTAGASVANHALVVLNVNDDGSLSYVGHSDNIGEKVLHVSVDADSGTLYALSATKIYAYSVGSDGTFTLLGSYTPGASFGTAITMRVADDTVYVLSGSRLTVYGIASDGTLTYAGQMLRTSATLTYTNADGEAGQTYTLPGSNAFNGAISMTVSDQGYIYLVTTNGYITTLHYESATNALTLVGAQDAYTPLGQYPYAVELSADGTALYMAGASASRVIIYSIGDDGLPSSYKTLSTNGISRFVISADGSSVYGGKHLFFGTITLNTIQATGVAGVFAEGDSAVLPVASLNLSDADYDALDGGAGNYNGASITISRSGDANAADIFGFADGSGLTLSNGVISLNGTAIASFNNEDGTLAISFTADVTTATANLVLQQISYDNTSNDPGSTITLKVTVGDAYASSAMEVLLTVAEINDAPLLTASPIAATYVAGAASGVRLFDDTSVSAVEAAQAIASLTLTVSGVEDGASEILTIDGSAIALVAGTTTTASGYSVTITLDGDTATVTIAGSAGIAVADAAKLVDDITYANEAASSGSRTVTLTAIQDNGGTANDGSDSTVLSISSTVTLSNRNSAPTLSSTAASTTYTENAEAVTPFSATHVSTVEGGQAILALSLNVAGLADGESETLLIDGQSISLVEGETLTANGYTVTVTLSGNSASVTISSANGIAVENLAALVDGLAYANASDDPTTGNRTLTLISVQDNGGSANSGSDSTTLNIAASIAVLAVNDAPVLQSTPTQALYAASGSSTTLFSGTSIDLVESGQSVSAITITASGLLNGRNETLLVDGTSIALMSGTTTTANGYSVTVSLGDDGSAIVTITATDGIAATDAAALIDGLAYVNLSGTYTEGERGFSLGVQDSGGTANGGSDSTTLENAASLTLVNNSAPVLGSTPDRETLGVVENLAEITGLADVTASVLSSDGNLLYAVSSDGAIALFSRNLSTGALLYLETLASGLSEVSDVQLSPDDGSLYVLGNAGDAIAVFTRSVVDGSLESMQVLATSSVRDFSVAIDGTLYVVDGNYSGLLVYSKGVDGQYALQQQIAAAANSEPYLFTAVDVQVIGEYVFIVTNPLSTALADTLIVYARNSDGTLGEAVFLRDGSGVDLNDPLALTVSADGQMIYVATADGVSIFTFKDGALAQVAAIDGLSGVSAIALAQDGVNLYVSDASGINRYDVSVVTNPVLLQALDSVSGVSDLSVAANGTLLAATRNGLVSLRTSLTASLALDYTEQGEQLIASDLTLSDAEYDAMDNGAGNYNGATISIGRAENASTDDSFGLVEGNGLSLIDGEVLHDGVVIARFVNSAGTLTLTFSADVTTATANNVLRQITYLNASNDPDSTITLQIRVTDAYGESASASLSLAVTGINDAPVLSTTPATTTYTEKAAASSLFSGTQISTVEAGQSIISLTLSVAGLADGASETLLIDGSNIALVAGNSGSTASGLNYSVSLSDSVASITLTSSSGLSSADAGALVDGIGYLNSSSDASAGTRTVTLTSLQDNGGAANDGSDTTALAISASVTVVAVNDAPTLSVTPASTRYTEGDAASSLFSATQISTVEAGQSITALTLSVAGLADGASERLVIDGSDVLLVDGNSGVTAGGLSYSVSVSNGVANISLSSSSGLSISAAAALIDGIGYANDSIRPTESTRTITLLSLSDSGGNEHGGSDTGTPNGSAAATVQVISVNEAPQASDVDFSLASVTRGTDYSVVLPAELFSDADGDNLSWSLSGLPAGLSFDPATLTITGTSNALIGDYQVTITVIDPSGATASRDVSMTVEAYPVTPLPETSVGQPRPNNVDGAFFGFQQPTAFQRDGRMVDEPLLTLAEPSSPTTLDGSLLRDSSQGFDNRSSLVEQLTNADQILTDSGQPSSAGSFSLDGSTLRSNVDLSQGNARSITLNLPDELPNGGTPQRVTQSNGMPLPSWASFNASSGELRIDSAKLQRDGVLRLMLISRDGEGNEQRTPLEIRAEGAPDREAPQSREPAAESVPQQLQQNTSGALLSEALELLDQLSDLAGEPVAVTTRHIA